MIGGSGSGKINASLNLRREQDDIDKIYLYVKDLSEPKYEFLIKKREDAGKKHLNDPDSLIEYDVRTFEYNGWRMYMKILIITTQAEKL